LIAGQRSPRRYISRRTPTQINELAQNPGTVQKSSVRSHWPARKILRPGNFALLTALLYPFRLTPILLRQETKKPYANIAAFKSLRKMAA
jgi:hypothetical protein